ncbi:MAG: recombinase family protein [Thermoleophilia bacterium]
MRRPLIGYVRVAPRERSEGRPDLDSQRRALARAAEEKGWELVDVFEDVRSGRTMRRPGLRAAMAACRRGRAEGVAVARLDRLTYSLMDLAELVREAMEDELTIVCLDPEVDLASDGGRAVGEVLAEAATWQPRPLESAGRTLSGRPGRPSSTPPAVAARIRSLRAQGMTLQAICDTLNEESIPTPRGGSEWRPTSLRAVLRSGAT